ncbi:hypothetical protein [Actinomadura sp.]|jgi:hypothetical protein|uniref:hypothetical protein n=1 Tax=Actinomadura sp. TaxID=1989 RepID=UPI0037C7E41E
MEVILRVLAEFGPAADWIAKFAAAVITALIIYLGLALVAVLRAEPDNANIRYRVFRDLLDLFRRRWRR